MKIKITTTIQMFFWMLVTFLVFIFLPEKWALNQDELKLFFSFVDSMLPGINASVDKSTYPETMRVLFSVMWVTVPLQIPGYIHAEYNRMKEKNIIQPLYKIIMMFVVALGIFFLFAIVGVHSELHQNEGRLGEILNLLYTDILGVIVYVYIVVVGFSVGLSIAIAQLFVHLNQKKALKEK